VRLALISLALLGVVLLVGLSVVTRYWGRAVSRRRDRQPTRHVDAWAVAGQRFRLSDQQGQPEDADEDSPGLQETFGDDYDRDDSPAPPWEFDDETWRGRSQDDESDYDDDDAGDDDDWPEDEGPDGEGPEDEGDEDDEDGHRGPGRSGGRGPGR
jgi:hypothetical protein